jgi:adenylate kinase
MRLILLGPPGVGKGTQAKLLASVFSISHISTGDILREAAAAGTELGMKAKELMDAGHLVPDEVMIGIIRDVLRTDRSVPGFVLDGFPRTVPQALALTKLLEELNLSIDRVINMEVDEEEVVRRLGKRLTCQTCGRTYNVETDRLIDSRKCPNCGGKLVKREDDKPATIRKRLRVYAELTAPVKDYYTKLGLLENVSAKGTIEQVKSSIMELLDHS